MTLLKAFRFHLLVPSFAMCVLAAQLHAQSAKPAAPVFADGLAQVVEGFNDPGDWIQHDLWVETEFDSDGDGKLDRVHVDVTRQKQTDSEGLEVAVIYETSPYFSGVAGGNGYYWDTEHELGKKPRSGIRRRASDIATKVG